MKTTKQSSNIAIVPDDIRSTETFKRLSKIQKKIYINRSSRISIQNFVNICLNVGIENWLKTTNGNWFQKSVVVEIVENKIKESC